MVIENVFESTDSNLTVRQANARFVEQDPECQQVVSKLKEIEKFLESFGFLTFGRDLVFGTSGQKTIFFSLENVMTSLELTMGSVIACCESACIAECQHAFAKVPR